MKVVSNHKRLPASNPGVCFKTRRDVSECERNTSVLCYGGVRSFFFLKCCCPSADEKCWETKFVFARVRTERHRGEGVKTPRLSKINPLSHGLTFTAAPERGSVRGGCPASASSSRCAGRGFPSAEEKSSIDGSRRSCGRVRRGPRGGQERGGRGGQLWDFSDSRPRVACLRVGRVCVEMHDV